MSCRENIAGGICEENHRRKSGVKKILSKRNQGGKSGVVNLRGKRATTDLSYQTLVDLSLEFRPFALTFSLS